MVIRASWRRDTKQRNNVSLCVAPPAPPSPFLSHVDLRTSIPSSHTYLHTYQCTVRTTT